MATTIFKTDSALRPAPAPRTSVVVVSYNSSAHLDECLGALLGGDARTYEVLVVDNGSTDGSPELVRARFPAARLLATGDNLGYSGAVNHALSSTRSDYVAVLNPDAMVEPGWLEPLVAFLDAHPHVGAVTPKILLYDRPRYINALGQHVHVTALGFNRAYNRRDEGWPAQPFRVSGLHGAAFVVRRGLLERMGGMNAACFMYHEDVDLSWLIQLMGYEIYCVPEAAVRHKYVLKMDPQKLFYLERNRVAMLLSNMRWHTLLALAPLLALTEAMMAAYCLKRGPRYLGAKLRSLAWNWRERGRILRRRAQVRSLRRRSDWEMLRGLRLSYEWDQLLTLGRQRGGRASR